MHTKFGYIQKKFRTNNIKKLDKKILYGNIQIPYVMFTKQYTITLDFYTVNYRMKIV